MDQTVVHVSKNRLLTRSGSCCAAAASTADAGKCPPALRLSDPGHPGCMGPAGGQYGVSGAKRGEFLHLRNK